MALVRSRARRYTLNMGSSPIDDRGAGLLGGATDAWAFEPAAPIDAPLTRPDAGARCVQVIGDDLAAAERWCESLHDEGLLTRCGVAMQIAAAAADTPPCALVLHVTRRLPDRLGLLRQLRALDTALPLLVVCHPLRDLDHVLALEMGADDVLDADTAATVVAARLRALVRRQHTVPRRDSSPDELVFGALALRLRERRVQLFDTPIHLTESEFEVLWLLAAQAGRAVSRVEMLRCLRGLPYQRIDRSIDCRIYRIRAKLGDTEGPAQRIRTVRNCGYLFSPAAW